MDKTKKQCRTNDCSFNSLQERFSQNLSNSTNSKDRDNGEKHETKIDKKLELNDSYQTEFGIKISRDYNNNDSIVTHINTSLSGDLENGFNAEAFE